MMNTFEMIHTNAQQVTFWDKERVVAQSSANIPRWSLAADGMALQSSYKHQYNKQTMVLAAKYTFSNTTDDIVGGYVNKSVKVKGWTYALFHSKR